jgi:hypothetical protein
LAQQFASAAHGYSVLCIVVIMAKDLTPEIKSQIQHVLEKFGLVFLRRDEQPPKRREVVDRDCEAPFIL